jgi:hypothetical protein
MYKFGSIFYGLMFVVTYPAYSHFVNGCTKWGIGKVALHSLLSSCAVRGYFEGKFS